MSGPNFEKMTKDEVIEWFRNADDVSPVLVSLKPATEPVVRPAGEAPMMLVSIRLPVILVEQLDSLANLQGMRRSEVIREALAGYVTDRTSPVGRDEAERALDVLHRIVASRTDQRDQAA